MKEVLSVLLACTAVIMPTEVWSTTISQNVSIKITGNTESTTFNPSDKASNVVLSNNNLTATINGSSWGGVVSTTSQTAGKYYLELTINQEASGGGQQQVGFANSSASLTTYQPSGALAFDVGGGAYNNGTYLGNVWPGVVPGHVLGLAINLGASLAWIEDITAGTGWNVGSSGTQNPGTGQGGVSFSGLATPLFVWWASTAAFTPAGEVTANFGGSPFVGTVPTGFSSWNDQQSGSNTGGNNVNTPVTANWQLIFDDEFNGTSLSSSNWNAPFNCAANAPYSGNNPANVSVANGFLTLEVSTPGACGLPWSGAFVQSTLTRAYGYYETLARMSRNADPGVGMWPAFWMNNNGNFPEIDFFENYSTQPTMMSSTYHGPSNSPDTNSGSSCPASNSDFYNTWHVFGANWTPTGVDFYFDGIKCFSVTGTPSGISTPMNMLVDAEVGGWTGFNQPPTISSPQFTDFAYIHVYCNPATSSCPGAVTPQPNYGGPGDTTEH